METAAKVAVLALTIAVGISSTVNANTVGLTLPGTGVAIGPVTNTCKSTLSCPVLASDLESGYSTPAQASFNGSWNGTNASEDLTATGYASVGVLKDSVNMAVTSGNYPVTGIYGDAASFVEDTITIFDPSLNGTQGSLALGMSIDGTGSATQSFNSNGIATEAAFSVYAGTPMEGLPPATLFPFTTSISSSYTGAAIPFTYGQSFGIELYFEAVAGAACLNATACSPWNGLPVTAIANGADTAILDSLTVYDSNGNVLPTSDWYVSSGSGAVYTANGVVPEPSYSVLLVFVALILGVVRRHITKRNAPASRTGKTAVTTA